jgi:hypothetical protein
MYLLDLPVVFCGIKTKPVANLASLDCTVCIIITHLVTIRVRTNTKLFLLSQFTQIHETKSKVVDHEQIRQLAPFTSFTGVLSGPNCHNDKRQAY